MQSFFSQICHRPTQHRGDEFTLIFVSEVLQTDAELLGRQRRPRWRRLGGRGWLAFVQVSQLLVIPHHFRGDEQLVALKVFPELTQVAAVGDFFPKLVTDEGLEDVPQCFDEAGGMYNIQCLQVLLVLPVKLLVGVLEPS